MTVALSPYRVGGFTVADLVPLPPFGSARCAACGDQFARPDGTLYSGGSVKICRGRWRGFLGLRKCPETRPHVHMSHDGCGASWVTAPFDPSARLT